MRRLLIAVGLGAALTTPAVACEFHGAGFGPYAWMIPDEGPSQDRRAEMLAERERVMENSRRSFLARFDVEPQDAAELKPLQTPKSDAPAGPNIPQSEASAATD